MGIPKGHPCVKECPDRTAVCRKDCEKLKEYLETKEEIRKKKDERYRIEDYIANSYYRNKKEQGKNWNR